MINNEERREVSTRLRELNIGDWHDSFDELWALEDACGCDIGQDWQDVSLKDRLADLIEPEPERTCTIDDIYFSNSETDWGKCSNCNKVFPYQNDVVACPKCGAKVVDE